MGYGPSVRSFPPAYPGASESILVSCDRSLDEIGLVRSSGNSQSRTEARQEIGQQAAIIEVVNANAKKATDPLESKDWLKAFIARGDLNTPEEIDTGVTNYKKPLRMRIATFSLGLEDRMYELVMQAGSL